MLLILYFCLFLLGNCVGATIDDISSNGMNDASTSSPETVDECVICLEELRENAIKVCQRNVKCLDKAKGCGIRIHEECIEK